MCFGADIIGTVLGPILSTGGGGGGEPQVVRAGPDQATIDTQAAQEAQAAKLAKQQRARANSLLSSYGGAGDLTEPDTTRGQAKPTLGA
jgi:hypothetical protein